MTSGAMSWLVRWLLPVVLGSAIAGLAWRAGSLSRSGAIAAAIVGMTAMWAGVSWGLYLVIWFAIASLASRLGAATKHRHTAGVVAKGGARDAVQVLANGGVFAMLAACHVLIEYQLTGSPAPHEAAPHEAWLRLSRLSALAGAAALAAAGADTLATEIGTWRGGAPRSVRTGQLVPPGTSGAVSVAGSVALLAAAVGFAMLAALTGMVRDTTSSLAIPIIAFAGIGGALIDTLLGAWYQQERWCANCDKRTEQLVHVCGTTTIVQRGLGWLTNDGVNVLCTLTGALLAAALAWRWQIV